MFSLYISSILTWKRENVHYIFHCKRGDKTMYFNATLRTWICPVKMGKILWPKCELWLFLGCAVTSRLRWWVFPSVLCVSHGEGGLHLFSWGKPRLHQAWNWSNRKSQGLRPSVSGFGVCLCCEGYLLPSFRHHLVPSSCFSKLMPCRCKSSKGAP